jgi:hypothetical protein
MLASVRRMEALIVKCRIPEEGTKAGEVSIKGP